MMKPYFGVCWSIFANAGVSSHFIYTTKGGLGIPKTLNVTPQEMTEIRTAELTKAMETLHATVTLLSFPDLHLPFIPFEQLVKAVLPIIREKEIDAIFSFHPNETTLFFDHPDHNVVGKVAKCVGAAADVTHFLPESPALNQRPHLFLWTTNESLKNEKLPLSKKSRKKRNEYLIEHYPSQFSKKAKKIWKTIFHTITKKNGGKHEEWYEQVR